jgi:hypothetical protein
VIFHKVRRQITIEIRVSLRVRSVNYCSLILFLRYRLMLAGLVKVIVLYGYELISPAKVVSLNYS